MCLNFSAGVKYYAWLYEWLSILAVICSDFVSIVYKCAGRSEVFCSSSHLNCSPQQFWEVFLFSCPNTLELTMWDVKVVVSHG